MPESDPVIHVDGWQVVHRRGTVSDLHAAPPPDHADPSFWWCDPESPALVLGSAQARSTSLTTVTAGVEVVVRRSGGAAVLLEPGLCTWVDLLVPAGHRLWDDDVGRAAHWVGDLWVRALDGWGIEASTHRAAMRRTEWSSLVCLGGVGPGEVLDASGRKLVGISQRRTRHLARFQTVAYHQAPSVVADHLGLSTEMAESVRRHLDDTTATVPGDPARLVQTLIASLPT